MTDETRHYLTGAARFNDGFVDQLVVYCCDPLSPELEATGYMKHDYIVDAASVISDIKEGHKFAARFDGSPKLYLLEIVVREGRETLEVANVGQPAEFNALSKLPLPGV
ncbi:hypothetical protein [Polaromonas sp.]|uniref:hypothetical protein n=1 Tax=Polaromonas sp. TaxID=1869339 RepID=UPI003C8B2736